MRKISAPPALPNAIPSRWKNLCRRTSYSMNKASVLIIGSGGREPALARSLSLSPGVGTIFCAPGNGSISSIATPVELDVNDHNHVIRFVEEKKISLTIIGPEAPLVAGLADSLRAKGHLAVGASRQ